MASKKINNKKTLFIIIVLVGLAVGSYWLLKPRDSSNKTTATTESTAKQTANEGPSDEDKAEATTHKEDLANDETKKQTSNQGTSSSQTSTVKTVDVVINYAEDIGNAVEVGAYAEAFENSGNCTLTLTKGSQTVSATRHATPNVSTMSCGTLSISQSKLSAGNWNAKVNYSSSKAKGSASSTIVVK